MYILLLIIAGECLLAAAADILFHKIWKANRSPGQWMLLCSILVAAVVCTFWGAGGAWNQYRVDKNALYLSYRYLMDGEPETALEAAAGQHIGSDQSGMLRLLSACRQGDTMSAWFLSNRLLNENEISGKDRELVEEIRAEADPDAAGAADEEWAAEMIQKAYRNREFHETGELEEWYLLDKKVRSGDFTGLSYDKVSDMISQYGNDERLWKLAVRCVMADGDYKSARQYARDLLAHRDSAENRIIYTDVIAESAMRGYSELEEDDKEVEGLLKEAAALREEASQYEEGDVKKDRLINRAAKLEAEAFRVEIRRAVNYLQAKKPVFYDRSGLYDIQIAKLYLACDERDKARELIYDVITSYSVMDDRSPLKESLTAVIDAYNQSDMDHTSPLLSSSVDELVRVQSQGVIQPENGNVNGDMADYITSTLKYDKIGIHIGRIDTAGYPMIRAYVNVNGEKDGIFGMASHFKEKDFSLIDTQYGIKDFRLTDEGKLSHVSIAIVLDSSGSMDGSPFRDSQTAARACIEKMDPAGQGLALVSYNTDAAVVTSLTSSKETLIRGVDSLSSGGGTNIPAGIEAGMSALAGADQTRALILMSDGQDQNTEAMDLAISRAVKENIAVFTVGLGDVDASYLQDIASRTGGKYLQASSSVELEDIYVTLQKYIVNNYCFEYTVTKNPETDPRNLTVSLPAESVSASRDYTISSGAKAFEIQDEGIRFVPEGDLAVTAVTPGNMSVGSLEKGVRVTVTGSGFTDGMHFSAGALELTEITVTDEHTATGLLKGKLPGGSYPVQAVLPDGRTVMKENALLIFRAGTTQSVRIGTNIITADTIGQTGDRSFTAMGNVMINGFIHSGDALTVTAYELPKDCELKPQQTAWLGSSGALSGNSRLYISYAQARENGTGSALFANLVLGGRDMVVRDGEFAVGISGSDTDFEKNLHDYNIRIPFLVDVDAADIKLYADRIQIHVDTLSAKTIMDSVKEGLSGNVLLSGKEKSAVDAREKVEKRSDTFKFKCKEALDGSVDLALTAEDIRIGIEAELNLRDSLQFGVIGLSKVGLKLNSLDPDHEYWKLCGAIDFSSIVKGFGGSGMEGLSGDISSYYWCFDQMNVKAELNPGFGVYNVLYIDELGMGMEGVSTVFLNTSWVPEGIKRLIFTDDNLAAVDTKDVVLKGLVGADVNLFKTFKLKVPEEMSKWGELGNIDGTIQLNFSEASFGAEADLNLLGQKMADAAIAFGRPGLSVKAGLELEAALGILDCSIGGSVDFGIDAGWDKFSLSMGIDGHIDCGFLNVHHQGKGELVLTAEYDGSYFAAELHRDNLVSKYWYDSDGKPLIWERFHTQTYFD